jgi:hypothetical protein
MMPLAVCESRFFSMGQRIVHNAVTLKLQLMKIDCNTVARESVSVQLEPAVSFADAHDRAEQDF